MCVWFFFFLPYIARLGWNFLNQHQHSLPCTQLYFNHTAYVTSFSVMFSKRIDRNILAKKDGCNKIISNENGCNKLIVYEDGCNKLMYNEYRYNEFVANEDGSNKPINNDDRWICSQTLQHNKDLENTCRTQKIISALRILQPKQHEIGKFNHFLLSFEGSSISLQEDSKQKH